jgi:hypothetical protein
MKTFIRSPFFLILLAIFSILFFGTTAYADHTPHKHKPRKPGLPGYNKACDPMNGFIGTQYERAQGTGKNESADAVGIPGRSQLVGQTTDQINKVSRFGNRGIVPDCINHTKYGYPINLGEPGYVDVNNPDPIPYDGPGYKGIRCDSRQDQSTSGNNTWESGSCIDDKGKSCCVNTTLAGYPLPPGEAGYVIQQFDRDACAGIDNRPPFIRDMQPLEPNQKICDLIEAEKSGTSSSSDAVGGTIRGGQDFSPGQSELAIAKNAKLIAEQQITTAQTELDTAKAAELAAEQQLATAKEALVSATTAEQEALQAVQDEEELFAKKIKEQAEKIAAIEDARKEAEAAAKEEARLAKIEKDKQEAERIKVENERLAALEKAREEAAEAARLAAEETKKLADAEAAKQADELASTQAKATDEKASRQAAEDAAKLAAERAAQDPNDTAAQLALAEAKQKSAEVKIAYDKAAEEAQKEAAEAARLAAEELAKQAVEVAAAQAKADAAAAAQQAAQELANQAAEHAAQIREAWDFSSPSIQGLDIEQSSLPVVQGTYGSPSLPGLGR